MRIVYNSFDGRYADSPRALHEALTEHPATADGRLVHTWLAGDAHRHAFPAGTATVPPDGPEATAALEAADLVVSNTHLSPSWRKAPGARYLQTWHGTPLKRIAADERSLPPGAPVPGGEDVARWDLLLSPGPATTPRLRSAFRWSGRVAETGSPRNDLLLSPLRDDVRRATRERLGIAEGTTAVLYTPTWRDSARDAQGRVTADLHLDLDAFAARLGPGHVLLLRLHPWVTAELGPLDVPGVLDVSDHPDVRELYLATDAMVTDYSSTVFDFAVTGKPVLFFTYDLAHYRDDVRGFYLDLEAVAPGPLAATTDELLDALADLPAVAAAHEERYARFRAEHCALDDGRATQRVLDLVLGADALGADRLAAPAASGALAGAR